MNGIFAKVSSQTWNAEHANAKAVALAQAAELGTIALRNRMDKVRASHAVPGTIDEAVLFGTLAGYAEALAAR